MKKIISFSLWGNNDLYISGAYANIKLAKVHYPDWICRFYVSDKMDKDVIKKLQELGGEVLIRKIVNSEYEGAFWRFEASCDPSVSIFISRDCDSRLNDRERKAVDNWLESGYIAHIMRDHPKGHPIPILAGMWGIHCNKIVGFENSMRDWNQKERKGRDQDFLMTKVWPLIKESHLCHDEYFDISPKHLTRSFPYHKPLEYGTFVGDIIDPRTGLSLVKI